MAQALIENINSANWQLSSKAIGEIVQGVEDIGQQIDLVLSTAVGSDPLRPLFGCDFMPYIGQPISQVLPSLVAAINQAAERWLPNIAIEAITARPDVSTLALAVTWRSELSAGTNIIIYQ